MRDIRSSVIYWYIGWLKRAQSGVNEALTIMVTTNRVNALIALTSVIVIGYRVSEMFTISLAQRISHM